MTTGGGGCKPMITADRAPGSGIMGDGAIDGRGGARLLGQDVTWWELAHTAKVLDQRQTVPRMLAVSQSDNFTLYRITLRNSPNFHVGVNQTNGFTAWGVKIHTPHTARNTDGIDPSSSTNVTIVYCDIAHARRLAPARLALHAPRAQARQHPCNLPPRLRLLWN